MENRLQHRMWVLHDVLRGGYTTSYVGATLQVTWGLHYKLRGGYTTRYVGATLQVTWGLHYKVRVGYTISAAFYTHLRVHESSLHLV